MAGEPLSAAALKRLRALKNRKDREAGAAFLAEGEHLVLEALDAGLVRTLLVERGKIARFAQLLEDSGLPISALSEQQFDVISDTKTPQGIAAVCRLPGQASLADLGERIVALNALQDPGNVGTILRSIDAAGFTGLLMDRESADVFSSKALRASMGSAFRMPVRRTPDLAEDLRSLSGYDIVAASLDGEPFYGREGSSALLCLLIGNEGAGLHRDILKLANVRLKLPMLGGAESLNAAVAASVMMYEYARQRITLPGREEMRR